MPERRSVEARAVTWNRYRGDRDAGCMVKDRQSFLAPIKPAGEQEWESTTRSVIWCNVTQSWECQPIAFAMFSWLEAGPGSHSQREGIIQAMNIRRQGSWGTTLGSVHHCPQTFIGATSQEYLSRRFYQHQSSDFSCHLWDANDILCPMAIAYKCWRIQDLLVFIYFWKYYMVMETFQTVQTRISTKDRFSSSFPFTNPILLLRSYLWKWFLDSVWYQNYHHFRKTKAPSVQEKIGVVLELFSYLVFWSSQGEDERVRASLKGQEGRQGSCKGGLQSALLSCDLNSKVQW